MIGQRSLPQALGILAVVQGLLAVVMWWPTNPAAYRLRPLLSLERDAITEIEISRKPVGPDQTASVQLVRKDGSWIVHSSADYPASAEKVDGVLDQLTSLKVGSPIATHETSYNALNVGEEEYGRRIDVTTASEHIKLWVGAATSNSVNVRVEGQPEVYRATGVSEWSFRDSGSSYYDSLYVQADPAGLDAVSVRNQHGTLRFEKKDDQWTLAGLAGSETADPTKIEALLKQLTRVRMVEPVSETVRTEYGLDGRLRVDWTAELEDQSLAGGYKVGADVDSNSYVKAIDHPFVVTARKSSFDALRDAKRADFLRKDDAPGPEPGS